MPRPFADRLQDIEPFRVVEVMTRAKQLELQGVDVVHMEVGEPDFSSIAPVIEAGRQALADGLTHYSPVLGIPELRKSIADMYRREYGLDIPAQRVVVTSGASGALLLATALLVNPGDGILMTDPGYPCNRHFLRLVEGQGQLVPVEAQEHYQLDAQKVLEHWRGNTIGAMVASPANPTGEILTRADLQGLSDAVGSKNGCLIVDEIYHGLTYGKRATSVLEVSDEAYVINSFSKYYGMTGWRLGWMVVPPEAVAPIEKLAQNLFISLSTIAQYAALAALQEDARQLLEERRNIFAQRRDFLLSNLRRLGFDISHAPAGAFYLYANISAFSKDSKAFCLKLLEEHGVAITPGEDFGRHRSDEHVRFAYTTGLERLEVAIERLEQALK